MDKIKEIILVFALKVLIVFILTPFVLSGVAWPRYLAPLRCFVHVGELPLCPNYTTIILLVNPFFYLFFKFVKMAQYSFVYVMNFAQHTPLTNFVILCRNNKNIAFLRKKRAFSALFLFKYF